MHPAAIGHCRCRLSAWLCPFLGLLTVLALSACTATSSMRESVVQEALVLGSNFLKAEDRDAAIAVYVDALERVPDDHRLLYNLSLMYVSVDRIPDAIAVMTKLTETNPANVVFMDALAKVLLHAGDVVQACGKWEQLLALDPYDQKTRLRLARLYADGGQWSDAYRHAMMLYNQRMFTREVFILLSEASDALGNDAGGSWARLAGIASGGVLDE